YLKGQYPLGLQAPDELAGEIANVEFFGLPQDFIATYPEKIGAVSMADVKRVLKTYFCTDDLKILVVSNGELAKQALDGLGALEMKEIGGPPGPSRDGWRASTPTSSRSASPRCSPTSPPRCWCR